MKFSRFTSFAFKVFDKLFSFWPFSDFLASWFGSESNSTILNHHLHDHTCQISSFQIWWWSNWPCFSTIYPLSLVKYLFLRLFRKNCFCDFIEWRPFFTVFEGEKASPGSLAQSCLVWPRSKKGFQIYSFQENVNYSINKKISFKKFLFPFQKQGSSPANAQLYQHGRTKVKFEGQIVKIFTGLKYRNSEKIQCNLVLW